MGSPLISAGLWLAVLCGAAILVGALLRFSQWAVAETLAGIWFTVRSTVAFVAFASRWLADAMQRATRFVIVAIWHAIVKALRMEALRAPSRRAAHGDAHGEAYSEHRQRETGVFGDSEPEPERSEPQPEAPEQDEAQGDDEQRDYERALALLGLSSAMRLTRMDMKRRHAELMSVLHPDKGFPNQQFAQQVNEAVAIIKRHHNWR